MAEQNCATRCAPPSRAVLSADGWTLGCAAHGARRTFSREPETSGRENIASDSVDRPAPGCPFAGPDADAPPVPQQAAALDLQWLGSGNARQRQHRYVDGQLQRSKKPQQIRGLNQN